MGSTISGSGRHSDYDDEQYVAFAHRVRTQLALLAGKLKSGALDQDADNPAALRLGAELELYLTDRDFRPLGENRALLAQLDDPHLQLELNRFNLEYNLDPLPLAGTPFSACADAVNTRLTHLNDAASRLAPVPGRVLAVGILPTLQRTDFDDCMTDEPRYHALAQGLRAIRGEPFQIQIEGTDGQGRVDFCSDDVSLEGANTSWQLHLRVAARDFADWYNAIQLVTPLALGMAGNSPLLFGQNLWEETRIALFRQSIDSRGSRHPRWRPPARVAFGEGWLRDSAWELFASAVALYPPILPECRTDLPDNALHELRLHMGTVWLWNRPVFDPADGGHLRIEMRALPAGPSGADMAATSAFLIGAANSLRPRIRELITALPFRHAEYNFVEAARQGLDARIIWPCRTQIELFDRRLNDIITELLPAAQEGLTALGVDASEARHHCDLIRARLESGQTGSRWLRAGFHALGGDHQAASMLLERYARHQADGKPVHTWPRAGAS
ncbi:hypothetical protein K8B33_04340 [Alcanivorax sp. JB21]|uniref:hypothetical protein n=1 Tax=Alcanivorax limicola TaxID=2874102 RepID=UPI001CC19094|nr:hypothetical protein [Alcanivorax limicola]MBZ2188310.1 hypothetical protein [Alcanivorax limicola]